MCGADQGVSRILRVCVSCAQLWPTLCDSMDCNPPGFSVHGIFQARILEWVAISYSGGSSQSIQASNSCLLCLLPWQADPLPVADPHRGSQNDSVSSLSFHFFH